MQKYLIKVGRSVVKAEFDISKNLFLVKNKTGKVVKEYKSSEVVIKGVLNV